MDINDQPSTLFTKDFLSKISHHSRSPFNGLLGFSELLLLNQKDIKSESATDYILRINMLAKKAFVSSENIILFLKLYSKNIFPTKSNTLFSAILNQSISLNKEAFSLKNIEFIKETDVNFSINCDVFLTGNIFTNIILKALKLCDDNSKITLTTKPVKQKQMISISYIGMQIESELVRDFFTKETKNSNTNLFLPELDIELWLCYQLAKIQDIQFNVMFFKNNKTTFSVIV